jgi:hypothetical protein
MKKLIGLSISISSIVLATSWLAFSWFESGSEITALCGNFHPGVTEESVITQLNTGDYLRYSSTPAEDGKRIFVDSLNDLGRITCTIEISSDGVVRDARLRSS